MNTSSNITSLNKVILPMIRRAMPNIIANSIIGVSPLTRPVSQVYTMKIRYASIKQKVALNKEHYKIFLRLYNRRQFTYHHDIIDAGYYMCKLHFHNGCVEWCEENFGKYGFIHDPMYGRFYFENINDQTFFKMRWL